MPSIENQKILKITDKNKSDNTVEFIEEDVVEVKRAKLIYYKWICRLMMLLASIMFIFSVCASLAILKLVPAIVIDPQVFVELSDSKSIVKREFINHHMESRERMMVNFIKQYVELRNTYIKDEAEMKKRWLWGGLVSYLSTYKIYREFAKQYPHMKADLDARKASRSVEIISVQRTGGENSNTWHVEFKTYDYIFGVDESGTALQGAEPTITEKYWEANVRGYADIGRRTAYRRLLNPLGFVIYSYFQSEKDI